MPRSANATTREARIAFDTRYAAPPTAIRYAAPCLRIASIATGPRSALPIIAIRPVFASIISRELVHARRRRRAGRADDFVAHRIDRADVVDDAVGEIDAFGQRARRLREHVGDALVRGVAAGEHLAVQQQRVAGLPRRDFLARQRVEIDARRAAATASSARRATPRGPADRACATPRAVEREMRVARRRAIRNHGDRALAACVG